MSYLNVALASEGTLFNNNINKEINLNGKGDKIMYTDPATTYRIDGIDQMVENIPARYKDILAFLKIQEGGVVHHNAGEADITNGYGIYKYAWPNVEIWKYIRSVGMIQGLPSETKSWSDAACRNVVTPNIDPKYDLWLSYKAYKMVSMLLSIT